MPLEALPDKYVNPFTDYGFKRLFGEEYNKDLLLDFLNVLLRGRHGKIEKIRYLPNEHRSLTVADRRAIFDIFCETDIGEKFIVELQKTKQRFFKDRTLYYSTFPIREQAEPGEWDYQLKAVYLVAILDFVFDDDAAEPDKVLYEVKLTDIETCKVFYDKLTFIYLEMPKFRKNAEECLTHFERWLYVLRNLPRLTGIPERFRERIFQKLFKAAEIARFNRQEAREYEDSLKIYRDLKNSLDTAREDGYVDGMEKGIQQGLQQGLQQGQDQGKAALIRAMLAHGTTIEDIARLTGLTSAEIEALVRTPSVAPFKVEEPKPHFTTHPPRPTKRRPKSRA